MIRRLLVGTLLDGDPQIHGKRGVSIIDSSGRAVYLSDAELPRVIALLAQHLNGQVLDIMDQMEVAELCDSDDLAAALTLTERRLADVVQRRQAICARQQAMVPAVAPTVCDLLRIQR